MRPERIKTAGYMISALSVGLLGYAAWPGAVKAGLAVPLVLGMVTSVLGMACRWFSYERERDQRRGRRAEAR